MPVDEVVYKSLWEEQEHIIMPGLEQAHITLELIALINTKAMVISNMHPPWGALAHGQRIGRLLTNAVADFEVAPFIGLVLRIALNAIATSDAALCSLAIRVGLSRKPITPDILRLPSAYLQYYKNLPSSPTELTLNISSEGERHTDEQWADNLLII
jgi:hypothetical protein